MPMPWELDWSGGGDPSGLDLPPIVPFFGRQRPPMLGAGGPAIVPPTTSPADQYPMPAMDPAAMQAAGLFPAAAADPSAMAGAGPSPALAAGAFAAPAVAPTQPFAIDALAQQVQFPSAGPLPDRFAQPTPPGLAATLPIPNPLSAATEAGGQLLPQPAAYDSWSGPAAQAAPAARPNQAGPDSPGLMLAQQPTTLPNGAPHMIPPSMLVHGTVPPTSARQPMLQGAEPKRPAAGDVRNAPQLQKEQLHVAPELFIPLPGMPHGMVNTPLWLNRLEHVGERWRPGQVSHAGARGPMQVTLIGARQAAQILGIKLDMNKWKYDPDYGRMLGQADAAYFLQRYGGDVVLATAAYNYGAHNLDKLMKRIGDPRRGEISHEQFTQNIPGKETRQYVKRVIYDNYTEERPDPKRTGSGRRLLPPLRPQKEWLNGV
jgi:hypothetical protein